MNKGSKISNHARFAAGAVEEDAEAKKDMKAKKDAGTKKDYLVEELRKATGRSREECLVIVNVFENGTLLGRQSKKELMNGLMAGLTIPDEEADKIYDAYIQIIMTEFVGNR